MGKTIVNQPQATYILEEYVQVPSQESQEEAINTHHLCCCEYLDLSNKPNHVCAVCCECGPLDDICDRTITCRPIPESLWNSLWSTIQDRARFPFCDGRGARKMDLEVIFPSLIVPLMLWISGYGLMLTILVLLTIQPLVLLAIYRKAVQPPLLHLSSVNRSHAHILRRSSRFFLAWTISSFVSLIVIFELQVVPYMVITYIESSVLVILCFVALLCAIVTRGRSRYPISHHEESDESKEKFLADSSSDFQISDTRNISFNLWIRCFIHRKNITSYILGLVASAAALLYGSWLSFTSLCTPSHYFTDMILLPEDCSEVYSDIYIGTAFAASVYSVLLAVVLSLHLIQLASRYTTALFHRKNTSSRHSSFWN